MVVYYSHPTVGAASGAETKPLGAMIKPTQCSGTVRAGTLVSGNGRFHVCKSRQVFCHSQ